MPPPPTPPARRYVLDTRTGLGFPYPVFLTTFHMALNTVGTRLLARFTHLMDGLKDVEMTSERWYRNILPIGALFSGSLVLSNMAYLTLSVSFIQMLKAFMPVAVLMISFAFGLKQLSGPLFGIVAAISFGVAMASYGEVAFAMEGFICQVLAIGFESSRLVMVQVLLQGLKMDPLVSLYYFAPVCACINACLIPFTEGFAPFFDLGRLGPFVLLTNGGVAFALNVAAVFLIGAASSLTLTLAGVLKDILLSECRFADSVWGLAVCRVLRGKRHCAEATHRIHSTDTFISISGLVSPSPTVLGSMFLLGSTVTGLQYLGYAIALAGLVAFKTYKG